MDSQAVTITLNDVGKITSVDWQAWLLNELALPAATRKDIAKTYGYLMRTNPNADWAVVNAAIIKRWSASGLRWIKEKAWVDVKTDRALRRAKVERG